jgi:hypothetical protein
MPNPCLAASAFPEQPGDAIDRSTCQIPEHGANENSPHQPFDRCAVEGASLWSHSSKLAKSETEAVVTRLGLNFIFSAALIVSSLAAIGQATAGTESFRSTCTNIRSYTTTQGRVLIAKCYQTGEGCSGGKCYKENARLVIPREGCRDIANREGSLVCLRGASPSSLAPPGGSWRASCRDGRYQQGSIFYAVCRTGFGGSANGTSINVASCSRPQLKSINGRLRCE